MNKQEMNDYLLSIGGLNLSWGTENHLPIVDSYFFGVGDGWLPIIKSLIEELLILGWDKNVSQVKEKFGGLRFYLNQYPEGSAEIISKYERLSYETCEQCGEKGTLRKGGWMYTLCDECDKIKKNKVAP